MNQSLTSDVEPQPVVCFGEALMRLSTPGVQRFQQASQLEMTFAGGEANVAVALATWGQQVRYVSKVPQHDLGTTCLQMYQRYGVETSSVTRGGQRLGIFYVENGTAQRGQQVIYDRQQSSFTEVTPSDFDWPTILKDAGWFHFTGTVPAVSDQAAVALLSALKECQHRQIPVSMDVGYRSALWTVDKARGAYQQLMPYIDVLIGSEQDAQQFFDIETAPAASPQQAIEDSLRQMSQTYGLRSVIYSRRKLNAVGHHFYSASLLMNNEIVHASEVELIPVDRIGTGDALAAGVIYGHLAGFSPAETLKFAMAASVLKHSIPGDFLLASLNEIQKYARGESLVGIRR